ncbi:sensor histidine kinase [Fictibacillus sp. BK138]|uniref:sensor histidine kinase n=1 Tax=Fictibacillus sp. BK138 TaxID=2512121 RepID=UPI0010297560|nr:sensor histidine kinase [Fictibacillus sp. BK138]RZT21430.1 two-component sensor histidine kinase [Fictibacillus sp. BK138]
MHRTIQELCTQHTNLTMSDIEIIIEKSKSLQLTADLTQANLFIDCPANDGKHAIVVAEAKPANAPSLYSKSVVGKYAYASFEPAVAFTHKTGKPMKRMRAITQEAKYVKQSVVPIKNGRGETIGSLIMEEDVSEQVQHEKKVKVLSETNEQLSQTLIGLTEQDSIISNMIQESLLLLDSKGKILYFNSCAGCLIKELDGKAEILGTFIHERLPFIKGIYENSEGILQQEVNVGKKVLEVKQIVLVNQRQITGILVVIRDLTELREKERQLMVKSAVIQEIHHRVKNNLQTVSSLLRLQMKRGGGPEGIQQSLNRISSIAAVHEELLESSKIDEVEIKQLIERIGQMSIGSRMCADADVSIDFHGEEMYLKSDVAVSLALTINELIQNCLKHAFKQQHQGKIRIYFSNMQDHFEVVVEDDGIGYSSSTQTSLGLDIVTTIVCHDLTGTFSIEKTNSGTKAVITFPLKEVEAV